MSDKARKNEYQNKPKLTVAEEKCLLDVRSVSKILGVSPQWIRTQVKAGGFIPSFSLGPRARRFRLCDLEQYVEKRLAEA